MKKITFIHLYYESGHAFPEAWDTMRKKSCLCHHELCSLVGKAHTEHIIALKCGECYGKESTEIYEKIKLILQPELGSQTSLRFL